MENLKKSKTFLDGPPISAEELRQKRAEKTIENWLDLQKVVKELESLEEMMDEQHEDHMKNLTSKLIELFTLKIKSRNIYDDIKFLKLSAEVNSSAKRPLDYYIEENNDTILVGAKESITKFLFIIRENYDYIPKIASFLREKSREKLESLAELFCNQFYDNVLISDPEQEELLICIYKLLEFEINKMHVANSEQFLDDSTFVGIFMTVFSKQHDLSVFVANLLNKTMYAVENKTEGCFDLSLYAIQRFFKRDEKKKKEEEKELDKGKKEKKDEEKKEKKEKENEDKKIRNKKKEELIKSIFKVIKKTEIHFKQNFELEADIEEENKKDLNIINENSNENEQEEKNEVIEIKQENKEDKKEDENEKNNKEEIKIGENLTFNKLMKKIKKEKNPDLKSLYSNIINQITDDPNTFCNEKLEEILYDNYYSKFFNELLNTFKNNLEFIQKRIEELIQDLIDRLTAIPYTVRCVCKIIDILISKRFPKLPKYLRHSFIGKFLFNKCIFPVLSLENKVSLKKIIFSTAQRRLLLDIITILSTANKCQLFTHYNDVEKIPLNHYLLELIPILNKFYDKLVDLRLPRQLNEYISHAFEDMESNTFSFGAKKITPKKQKKQATTYKYFEEKTHDEILRIPAICFNVDDAITLKEIIYDNQDQFKDLPKFPSVKKAIEEIDRNEPNIDQARKRYEKKEGKSFFFIYKIDKLDRDPKPYEFLNRKKSRKNKPVLWRIKDSIKTILKRLNLLDIKDYSYLSMATNNEKFLEAINYTLKDLAEEDEIPLSWYIKYIKNNLPKLDDKSYIENDLKKLYDEILDEDKKTLDDRKKLSSVINAREGMNIQFAKKAIEKIRYDKKCLEQTKQFQKIETFIAKDQTQVCIKVNEKIDVREGKKEENKSKEVLGKFKDLVIKKEKESTQYVEIVDANNCEHRSENFMAKIEGKRETDIKTHAKKVNQFISKFSIRNSPVKKLRILFQYIDEDIDKGEPTHELFKAFEDYRNLLKESIKNNDQELLETKVSSTSNQETDPREKELKEILDRIEDYIMFKIYKYVFPLNRSEHLKKLDYDFYEKTFLYAWIPPEAHGVKIPIQQDEIENGINTIKKLEEKAQTITEKLNCIKEVFDNINKAILFNTGKKEDLSTDDQLPLLVYIVIQAHPEQFITNIHYMKCFLNPNRNDNVFLQNMVSVRGTLDILNPDVLKIDKKEFNDNVEKARQNFKNMKK